MFGLKTSSEIIRAPGLFFRELVSSKFNFLQLNNSSYCLPMLILGNRSVVFILTLCFQIYS